MVPAIPCECEAQPLSFSMPLTAPSVQEAMDFLEWAVPSGVFSAGSGRRRGETPLPPGHRSDQGFLVFYRRLQGEAVPDMIALKSRRSISRYLQNQLDAGAEADHWVCTQITQYRGGRDGKAGATFRSDGARHILGIVADLDGHRMDPMYRRMLEKDGRGFVAALEAHLSALGVDAYQVVRSGPEGLHLYLPLIRNDGKPLRASPDTLADWERAAKGVCRYLETFGADANAVRAVQPFVIPGLPRAKHPGFIPYVVVRRDGARANLYALIRQLAALKQLMRAKPLQVAAAPSHTSVQNVAAILHEIRTVAAGVSQGERNQVAHDIAVYLLCKGARAEEALAAMQDWNNRNSPPLLEHELRSCLSSAERCEHANPRVWAEMQRAAWFRLRSILGLPTCRVAGYHLQGRWRPLTPRKSWEDRKTHGGREHYEEVAERVLRFVAGEGGRIEMTQAEIADMIDTNRSTLRAVLKLLEGNGLLLIVTRRGRGGKSVLSVLEPSTDNVTENGHSGYSSEAAEMGAGVGLSFAFVGRLSFVLCVHRSGGSSRVISSGLGTALDPGG